MQGRDSTSPSEDESDDKEVDPVVEVDPSPSPTAWPTFGKLPEAPSPSPGPIEAPTSSSLTIGMRRRESHEVCIISYVVFVSKLVLALFFWVGLGPPPTVR